MHLGRGTAQSGANGVHVLANPAIDWLRNSVAQVEGLTWYTGAISCAEWEGVALKDVLEYATWPQKQQTLELHVAIVAAATGVAQAGVPTDLGVKSELEGEDEQLCHQQLDELARRVPSGSAPFNQPILLHLKNRILEPSSILLQVQQMVFLMLRLIFEFCPRKNPSKNHQKSSLGYRNRLL